MTHDLLGRMLEHVHLEPGGQPRTTTGRCMAAGFAESYFYVVLEQPDGRLVCVCAPEGTWSRDTLRVVRAEGRKVSPRSGERLT